MTSTKRILVARRKVLTATMRQNPSSAGNALRHDLYYQVTNERSLTMTESKSDRSDAGKKTVRAIADGALEAFWQVVVQHFPEAVDGDLSPWATIKLHDAAEEALAEWIENNVPTTTKVGD